MESVNKIIEKEEIRKRKNPGKLNALQRKRHNQLLRGEPLPAHKVVESRRHKLRRRNSLKAQLRKQLRDID